MAIQALQTPDIVSGKRKVIHIAQEVSSMLEMINESKSSMEVKVRSSKLINSGAFD